MIGTAFGLGRNGRGGRRCELRPTGLTLGSRLIEASLIATGWIERRRQRRRLLELAADPDFLRDVGISRADALAEGRRRFWVR